MSHRARYRDTVLAESDDVFEANGELFFPRDDVREGALEDTGILQKSPDLGKRVVYHVSAGTEMVKRAAWEYPEPPQSAPSVQDHVVFGEPIVVEHEGEPVQRDALEEEGVMT